MINITFCKLIITGDGGAVCSEVLDSHNVTKSFVPKLSPSKSDSRKGNQDHPDEQQSPKVCGSITSRKVSMHLPWSGYKTITEFQAHNIIIYIIILVRHCLGGLHVI